MSLLASVFTGKRIRVPKVIGETFVEGEKVLYAIQQARLKQAFAPDSIFVTSKRVIIHRPRLFGLKRNIKDYKYADMANTVIDQGIISSTIAIKVRFLSDDVMLQSIPNKIARGVFRTIQDGIAGRLEPQKPQHVVISTLPTAVLAPTLITKETLEKDKDLDLMELLKRRYVMGELTKRQYNAMKKELMPTKKKATKKKKSMKSRKRKK